MLAVLVNLTCLDVVNNSNWCLQEQGPPYLLSITPATYEELSYTRLFYITVAAQDLHVGERLTDAEDDERYDCIARWASGRGASYGYDRIVPVWSSPVYSSGQPIAPTNLRLLVTHEYLLKRGWGTREHLSNSALQTVVALPGKHRLLFSIPVRRFQAFAQHRTLPTFEDVPASVLGRLPIQYECAHCGNTVAQIPTQSEPCPVRPGACEWLNRLVE
jgi:hypothetical protein